MDKRFVFAWACFGFFEGVGVVVFVLQQRLLHIVSHFRSILNYPELLYRQCLEPLAETDAESLHETHTISLRKHAHPSHL